VGEGSAHGSTHCQLAEHFQAQGLVFFDGDAGARAKQLDAKMGQRNKREGGGEAGGGRVG
jgi:hypothetical protein